MGEALKKDEKEYKGSETGKTYQKERLFFRELTAFTYSLREELKRLRKVPRVIKGKDIKLKKGPQLFIADVITPKEKITQVLYAHFVVLAPGGKSDKHGHMNEAMFYILDGKGHEIGRSAVLREEGLPGLEQVAAWRGALGGAVLLLEQ